MAEDTELNEFTEEGADAIGLGVTILVATAIAAKYGWTDPMQDAVAAVGILPTSGITLGILSIAIFLKGSRSEGTRGMA